VTWASPSSTERPRVTRMRRAREAPLAVCLLFSWSVPGRARVRRQDERRFWAGMEGSPSSPFSLPPLSLSPRARVREFGVCGWGGSRNHVRRFLLLVCQSACVRVLQKLKKRLSSTPHLLASALPGPRPPAWPRS
jgi:hypothetical protein